MRIFLGLLFGACGVGLVSLGWFGIWLTSERLPIMTCDPASLQRGTTEAEIIKVCGKPDSSDRKSAAWYPLQGDGRGGRRGELMMIYGSVWNKDHNVNLYLEDDKLRSVQIFGDYK